MNNDRNYDTGGSRGRRRRAGLRRAGVLAAAVAGIALAAACGGGSSTAAGSATHQQLLAYARCMRSHGVPGFPDPTSQGTFVTTGIDEASAQAKQANFACQNLLPDDGLPAANSANQEQLLRQGLKYAICMRSHGILNFPDPVPAGDEGVSFPIAGYDPGSPQVQSANKACNGPGS